MTTVNREFENPGSKDPNDDGKQEVLIPDKVYRSWREVEREQKKQRLKDVLDECIAEMDHNVSVVIEDTHNQVTEYLSEEYHTHPKTFESIPEDVNEMEQMIFAEANASNWD